MFYEKKKQFYFCAYHVSGNWFVIIFSRPVKAAADVVLLKANRTYTAYDVTGDGTKDKIRIRAANQTDDETYTSLTVSVNGKNSLQIEKIHVFIML